MPSSPKKSAPLDAEQLFFIIWFRRLPLTEQLLVASWFFKDDTQLVDSALAKILISCGNNKDVRPIPRFERT